MGLLTGKVALVTGATRGIGRAIALKYASEGADVAFTYLSSAAAAEELTKELEAMGVRAVGYRSDASSYEEAHTLAVEVQKHFGKIDILVHNAGITRDTLLMRMSEEMWDAVINTNLKSAFNITHAVAPIMARQRGGSIIYMSSVVGIGGNAGQANYAASKAGLIALSKSVAKEFGEGKLHRPRFYPDRYDCRAFRGNPSFVCRKHLAPQGWHSRRCGGRGTVFGQ